MYIYICLVRAQGGASYTGGPPVGNRLHFSICAHPPCAEAMLIFSASFQC